VQLERLELVAETDLEASGIAQQLPNGALDIARRRAVRRRRPPTAAGCGSGEARLVAGQRLEEGDDLRRSPPA
jgi:hypothetical protein